MTPVKEPGNPPDAIQYIQYHDDTSPHLWSRIRHWNQNAFSEFLGTFVFLLFSFGCTAHVGIMLGAYTANRSGGHLNPAVTLSMCIYRRFPWSQLPIYALSQTLGAFCAAGVIYGNYKSAIDHFEGHNIRTVPYILSPSNHSSAVNATPTAGIFATYPAPFMTTTGAFFSEFLASAVLMFCIFALGESKRGGGARNLSPLVLCFVFVGIATCFGWETGFAINPARDFGPRVMTWALGYGRGVWTARGYYFWIPIVAPFLGCVFGGWLFDVFLNDEETPINSPYMGLGRLFGRVTAPRTEELGSVV
ncbi:hypothetical protein BLS_008864 [Venturia inaequalis]|uniref:Aquaporin n=1 Tax=Venturia inaequalis TaxID=5025 RepID=A0A8H3YL79_VENIN|nr:hypothetical protein BLS_008864 [Venturia inaequalis]